MTATERIDTKNVRLEGTLDFGKCDQVGGERKGMFSSLQVYIDGKRLDSKAFLVFKANFYQCPDCGALYIAGKEPPECNHKF